MLALILSCVFPTQDAVSSWTMYIPGVGSSPEVTEIKSMNAMMDAMTDEELDNPNNIRVPARERIASSSGKVKALACASMRL